MSRAVRNPVLLVVAGLLLLQTAWILTIPPFRGSDEVDHAYRAAAVVRGEWTVEEDASDGRGQLVTVPESLVSAAHEQCERLSYMGPDNCTPVTVTSDGEARVATAAGVYHPAFYWVVGVAGLPFEGAASLYAMRIMVALVSAMLLGAAAWALGRLPGRWPLVGLVLAATPVLVYSTTIVAPNGVEISAGLCLWASLLALIRGESREHEIGLLWVAITAAVVMGTLRALGPIFILMIVATIALLEWKALWAVVRRHVALVVAGALLVGLSVANLAAWTLARSSYGAGGSEAAENFAPIDVLVWQMQSIAAFPFRDQLGPLIVYPVVGALVLALVVVGLRDGSTRERLVLGLTAIVTLAFPVAFILGPVVTESGFWQGRYMLPYGVGVVLVAGCILARRLPGGRPPVAAAVVAMTAYSAAIAACWIKIRGDENSHPASSGDSAWAAPEPLLLVVISGVAGLLFVAALTGRSELGGEGRRRADENEAVSR